MIKRSLFAILLIIAALPCVAKDSSEAFQLVKTFAEQGDPDAQFRLGIYLSTGLGVKADEAAAVQWFRKAAAQGHSEAQYFFSKAYLTGTGVIQSDKHAEFWLRKSIESSNPTTEKAGVMDSGAALGLVLLASSSK